MTRYSIYRHRSTGHLSTHANVVDTSHPAFDFLGHVYRSGARYLCCGASYATIDGARSFLNRAL